MSEDLKVRMSLQRASQTHPSVSFKTDEPVLSTQIPPLEARKSSGGLESNLVDKKEQSNLELVASITGVKTSSERSNALLRKIQSSMMALSHLQSEHVMDETTEEGLFEEVQEGETEPPGEGVGELSTRSSSVFSAAISSESNKSLIEEEEYLPPLEEESALVSSDSILSYTQKSIFIEEEVEEEEEPFVSVFERLGVEHEVLASPDPITEEMLKDISVDLGQIRLCWPKKEKPRIDFMPNVILPDGYLMNTNKEKLLLLYCENFRVQYHAKFPNRKPLLLCGDNVVGQRKMVCTTLRPTTLPHPDLSTWQELANFVSDHIKYEPIDTPTKLKSRYFSPHTVFTKKIGHAFEMSNALCSLLLGRNYSAYNVYGFATRDATERIMIRTDFPYEEKEEEEEKAHEEHVVPKYVLRPPRDLRSKFLMAMEQKDAEKQAREKERLEEIKRLKQLELEKPPYDELHCRRIHGWVLMMPQADEKDKVAPFFIEATTGMSHPIDSPLYCSIQSVWNNSNYWVNLQDDLVGIGNLSFDFGDVTKWGHILPGEPMEGRVRARDMDLEEDEESMETLRILEEKHLDMPEPWSLRVHVTHQDVTNRFPTGYKKINYKRTLVEKFSPYSCEDGLVMKIHRYSDIECTDLITIEERYKNRNDKWSKCLEDVKTGLITEFFDRGRDDNVKEQTYYKNENNAESWRTITYYHQSRFDCLKNIVHDELYLQEDYVQREDFFYYRRTEYAQRGDPPPGFIEGPRRIIKNIIEKFERNKNVRASDDIAVREFEYVQRQTRLQYHYDAGKITASTRVFLKPPLSEMVEGVSFRPELTFGYQAEIGAKPPKNSKLYAMLEKLLRDEEESIIKVRHVEDSIIEFIRLRALEKLHPKLDVGLFNREQNKENREAMLEKEAEDRTKKEREIEEELDYIRPYIVRDNLGKVLTYQQALKVRNTCLREFKALLLRRANDLQKRFQAQVAYVKHRRDWYNDEVEELTYEEEQDYFKELNQVNFKMHCMELQLMRMKEVVPMRMEALFQFLDLHPMLQVLKKKGHKVVRSETKM